MYSQSSLFEESPIVAILLRIEKQVSEQKGSLVALTGFIPKKAFQEFIGYGDTKVTELLQSGQLEVSQIGANKYISLKSLIQLLEKNIQ
ncbi:MAG TPA: hypothetical protein VD794_12045 [Flavisolibacter sp.]|nr:hypothetical protein [Flavisolibacter sp.]